MTRRPVPTVVLRRAIVASGLSCRELAKLAREHGNCDPTDPPRAAAGVTAGQISRFLRRQRGLEGAAINQLCLALGLELRRE